MFKLNQKVCVKDSNYPWQGTITFVGHNNEYEVTFSNGRIKFFNTSEIIVI